MAEKNNGIETIQDLDISKVKNTLDVLQGQGLTEEQAQTKVNQTLSDRGINNTPTPIEPVTTEPPVETIEPAIPTPVITEPKIETPAPIKTTKVETPKIETPVVDIQAVKSQELANQTTENTIKDAENTKTIANFEAALLTGNNQDILSMTRQNPELRDTFNSLVRNQFKTKSSREYFSKYSSFSNNQLNSAVKSGDIVVGSDLYNSLPELQRASFSQFQAEQNAISTPEDDKAQFTTDNLKTLSLDTIFNDLKKVFSSDLRTQYNEAMNSSEITSTAKDLEDKQNAINSLNDDISAIEDDVKEQFPNLPRSAQAAIMADRQKGLLTKKNTLVNEYNSKLGTYQSLKDEAKIELDFLKYEDSQNKALYNTALGLYETRRSEMRADEQAKFLAQNKKLSEERALDNAKTLAKYKQDLTEGNVKGEWESRFDGLYFLSDDGVAKKVIDGGLEVNNDGTSTYTYVNEVGKPIIENYDINGNLVGAGTGGSKLTQSQTDLLNAVDGSIIPSRLKTTTNKNGGKECAEYVNDIFAGTTGTRMGNTYASKLAVANESTGGLGAMAVWQPNPSNKEFSQYGHAGVIVGESDNGNSWHIKSSNLNGDGKISTVAVPKTVIAGYKTTNLFNDTPDVKNYNDAQLKFLDTIDIKGGFNKETKETIKSLGLTQTEIFDYKSKTVTTQKKEDYTKALSLLDTMMEAGGGDGFSDAIGIYSWFRSTSDTGEITFDAGTDAADFKAQFDALVDGLTLPNLDKMSGTLTDKDIELLKNASKGGLSLTMSEDGFNKAVVDLRGALNRAINGTKIPEGDIVYTDKDGLQYSNDTLKQEVFRLINTGEHTAEEMKAWLEKNNLTIN